MEEHKAKEEQTHPPTPDSPERLTRRKVLKIGAVVGVSLPLIVTLTPTEARAQETGGS